VGKYERIATRFALRLDRFWLEFFPAVLRLEKGRAMEHGGFRVQKAFILKERSGGLCLPRSRDQLRRRFVTSRL
jgi:hypothetical protein